MQVTADVGGTSFYEVTFQARRPGGRWEPIGTDDTAPYRVFHDVAGLNPGARVEYRAVALDNAGHTSVSSARAVTVPAPALTIQQPAEGSTVQGNVEVVATADPEKASHVVGFERSVAGGPWRAVGEADSSSPAYTATDDLAALNLADGTEVRYRATMAGSGFNVVSGVRTVLVGAAPQPESVTVAGSLNSEMGCPDDWQPACESAFMTLDPASRIWKLTADLPAASMNSRPPSTVPGTRTTARTAPRTGPTSS